MFVNGFQHLTAICRWLPTHARRTFFVLMTILFLTSVFAFDVHPVPAQAPGPKAIAVIGQADFAANEANRGGEVSATSINFPLGIVADKNGGIYLADRNNNRVLHFPKDATTPDKVFGQYGSFTSAAKNNDGKGGSGAPSAENLSQPTALALDSKGGLYVVDRDNHRVLYFANDGDTKADRVYGQFGSFTANPINNDGKGGAGTPNAENIGLFSLGAAVDSKDGLYVADSSNNRVLYFANDGDTKADRVYGQYGLFTSGVRNNDGKGSSSLATAENLAFPRGLAIDNKDGLYVADRDDNRVLYFANDGDSKADRVYGQYGGFTMNVPNNNGQGSTESGRVTADTLFSPRAVALDSSGGLYIADSGNNRSVYFANDGNTAADRVYGQYGNLGAGVLNNSGKGVSKLPSAENLAGPQGIGVSSDGRVWISDTNNNRVLVFEKPS